MVSNLASGQSLLFGCSQPLVHPRLSELRLLVVLVEAAASRLPLAFRALGSVVVERRLPLLVRQRIGRLWLPAHHSVLHDELDPLGRSVGPYRAQTVQLPVFVPGQDASLAQDFVAEVGSEAVLQTLEVAEASGLMLENACNDRIELGREQPEVVQVGLRYLGGCSRFIVEPLVLHVIVVVDDGLLSDHVSSLARATASLQDQKNSCREEEA